jgi:hypothetical protein
MPDWSRSVGTGLTANRGTLGTLADYLEQEWGRQLDRLAELAEAAETAVGTNA